MSTPPPPSSDTPTGEDPDLQAAQSPSTPPAEQQRIAAERPDLHAALAANPATYPELLAWLRTSRDPAVQTALAQRDNAQAVGAPDPEAPGGQAQPAEASHVPVASAPTAASATSRRRGRGRVPLLIGVTAVIVLALVGAGLGVRALLDRGGTTSPAASTVQEVSSTWTEGSHQA